MGLEFDIFDGSSFFKIGVTFADFQILCILPLERKKLDNGNDNEWDNS